MQAASPELASLRQLKPYFELRAIWLPYKRDCAARLVK
jgi:hypothetical protein